MRRAVTKQVDSEAKKQADEKSAQVKHAEIMIKTLKAAQAKIRLANKKLQYERQQLILKKKEAQRDYKRAQKRLDKFMREVVAAQNKRNMLYEDVLKFETLLPKQRIESKRLLDEIKKREKQLQRVLKAIDEAHLRIEKAYTKRKQIEDQTAGIKRQRNKLNAEILKMEARKKELDAEFAEKEAKLDTLNREIRYKRTEYGAEIDKHTAEIAKKEAKLKDLDAKLYKIKAETQKELDFIAKEREKLAQERKVVVAMLDDLKSRAKKQDFVDLQEAATNVLSKIEYANGNSS